MWSGVPVKMGHLGSMIFEMVLLVLLLGPLIKNAVMSLLVLSPPFPLLCFFCFLHFMHFFRDQLHLAPDMLSYAQLIPLNQHKFPSSNFNHKSIKALLIFATCRDLCSTLLLVYFVLFSGFLMSLQQFPFTIDNFFSFHVKASSVAISSFCK